MVSPRYKKLKVIGQGSFGCCWLVCDSIGDHVSLKEIDVSRMPKQQKEETANEVKVLTRLRHPFVINYRESFVHDGMLCIVTDYAERGDLYHAIHNQRRCGCLFSESLVIRWFTQASLALKHLHDKRVLHRDLKTQNIFLSGKGDGVIKIGDFGIARILQHTQDCARTLIGTPYYLSPEICQDRPYDRKSDIWALGCVLYEMASLQHAFDSDSMKGLIMKILKGHPPQIPNVFSYGLRSLVPDLLMKDPVVRLSIEEVLTRPLVRSMIMQLLKEIGGQRCPIGTKIPSKAMAYGNHCSNATAGGTNGVSCCRPPGAVMAGWDSRCEGPRSYKSHGASPALAPVSTSTSGVYRCAVSAAPDARAAKDRSFPDVPVASHAPDREPGAPKRDDSSASAIPSRAVRTNSQGRVAHAGETKFGCQLKQNSSEAAQRQHNGAGKREQRHLQREGGRRELKQFLVQKRKHRSGRSRDSSPSVRSISPSPAVVLDAQSSTPAAAALATPPRQCSPTPTAAGKMGDNLFVSKQSNGTPCPVPLSCDAVRPRCFPEPVPKQPLSSEITERDSWTRIHVEQQQVARSVECPRKRLDVALSQFGSPGNPYISLQIGASGKEVPTSEEVETETTLVATLQEGLGVIPNAALEHKKMEQFPSGLENQSMKFRLDGKTLDLPVDDLDSLSYRVEALRVHLEKELGLEAFLNLHRHLNSNLDSKTCSNELEYLIPPSAFVYLPLVHQLIVCEDTCFDA